MSQQRLVVGEERLLVVHTMKETDALVSLVSKPASSSNDRLPSVRTLLTEGVVLANEGSTARDHLANERTYLAWIRTALALTGVGIGLLKWQSVSILTGYLVLSMGVVALVSSTVRYFSVMRQLSHHRFEPNVRGVLAVVAVILIVIVTLLALEATHKL